MTTYEFWDQIINMEISKAEASSDEELEIYRMNLWALVYAIAQDKASGMRRVLAESTLFDILTTYVAAGVITMDEAMTNRPHDVELPEELSAEVEAHLLLLTSLNNPETFAEA